MNTRRAMLKIIGAAPAVATSAAGELAGLLGSPAFQAAGAALGASNVPGPQPAFAGITGVLGRQLNELTTALAEERQTAYQLRVDGLDADIAALRSTSRAFKVQKQAAREMETAGLLRAAHKMLWG